MIVEPKVRRGAPTFAHCNNLYAGRETGGLISFCPKYNNIVGIIPIPALPGVDIAQTFVARDRGFITFVISAEIQP